MILEESDVPLAEFSLDTVGWQILGDPIKFWPRPKSKRKKQAAVHKPTPHCPLALHDDDLFQPSDDGSGTAGTASGGDCPGPGEGGDGDVMPWEEEMLHLLDWWSGRISARVAPVVLDQLHHVLLE